jgi:DNA-binding GntR family transcriptional regulator
MPVRDALQHLTHEGLLQQQGHQRVVVSLGADELEEVNMLTAVLHGWAAGRAATVASDAELGELERIYQAEVETDGPYEFGRLAMQFHRKINLLAHSPRLIRTLVACQQAVPRTMPFHVPDQMGPSKERHRAVLAAIRDRDPERAERLTRSQAMESVALLMQSLEGH